MKGAFDKQDVSIPCKCGRKTKKTVAWLKSHQQFTCICGTRVTVDSSDFRREMGKVDKALSDLQKTIASFNKRK